MSSTTERRQGSDRRKAPRGGRRPEDKPGFAPLVLVVGDGRQPEREAEAILALLSEDCYAKLEALVPKSTASTCTGMSIGTREPERSQRDRSNWYVVGGVFGIALTAVGAAIHVRRRRER